ncbi:MAG TPA: N-methyl-L-tryptophan oxidase [Gammaproteobacteria bacterium]|nr:N-methyl-L-tryptophan oxidase [Gammaproteobacteria bacterium]
MQSKSNHYDIIVIGLGAVGSATLYQLTEKSSSKLKVLGIDQYSPPHIYGSSHGESRFTRLSGGEFQEYALTAQRSHELWAMIAAKTQGAFGALHHHTGGLMIGSLEKSSFLQNTIASAKELALEHRILDAQALKKSYPQFNQVTQDLIAYYEKDMGILVPEACIFSQLALAKNNHADIHVEEKLLRFERMPLGQIRIDTDKGQYFTDKLILSVGAWIAQLLDQEKARLFKIYRQVFYWFQVAKAAVPQFQLGQFPPTVWLLGNEEMFYAMPSPVKRDVLKVAYENSATWEASLTPEAVVREVSFAEQQKFYHEQVIQHLHGVNNQCNSAKVCLYTCTPNYRFLIDYLPGYDEKVIVASPCSGRGFKHSAAIGEALAAQMLGMDHPINLTQLFGGWDMGGI